jgi:hypothetical protein
MAGDGDAGPGGGVGIDAGRASNPPLVQPAGLGSLRNGRGAIATTSGGLVARSKSYRAVFTVGVGSHGSQSSSSSKHRLRAGPIGAAEGTP